MKKKLKKKFLSHFHRTILGEGRARANLKKNKTKFKKAQGMHNKEMMKNTIKGSKRYLRRKHQKAPQAHSKEATHNKEVTKLTKNAQQEINKQ